MPTDRINDDVAADMERIFKPLAGRMPIAVDDDSGGRVGREPLWRGLRTITLAAPALVIVVGTAMAIGYARDDNTLPHKAPIARSAPVPAISVRPSISPESAARAVASEPASAPAMPAAPPVSTTIVARPPTRSTLAPLPRLAIAEKPAPRRPSESESVAGVLASPGLVAERASAVPACEPGSEDDHCIYQDVLTADARLRLAYDRAVRSSVPGARLASVSRRWQRAQEDADYDPDGTIRRYEQLADALEEERRRVDR